MGIPEGATICECCRGKGYLAPMKVCANCGVEYRLQEGRATTPARKATGTKYCSRKCANAKSQRDRRARATS